MSVERDIRYELIARLCPNATGKYQSMPLHLKFSFMSVSALGAELRSVCTEAGMFAIRARRKVGCGVMLVAFSFANGR
jgi:26S proteasome regulatory subunit T1